MNIFKKDYFIVLCEPKFTNGVRLQWNRVIRADNAVKAVNYALDLLTEEQKKTWVIDSVKRI